jgi:hypothetical protein
MSILNAYGGIMSKNTSAVPTANTQIIYLNFDKNKTLKELTTEISGLYGGKYEDYSLLGYSAV